MSDQLTDPSREMASLADHTRGFSFTPLPNQPALPSWQVLSSGLAVDANSAVFLELLAAARSRLATLERSILALDDTTAAPDVKQHVREAIQRFALVFSPSQIVQPWQQVLGSSFLPQDATTFRLSSSTMLRIAPLRRLTDVERE
jgi:hypothetical protein